MFKSVFKCGIKNVYVTNLIFTKNVRFLEHSTVGIVNDESPFVNRCQKFDFSLESEQIYSVFPSILEEVIDEQLYYHQHLSELKERYTKLMNYTCYADDKFMGSSIMHMHAYKSLEKASLLNEENIKMASILAWCIRMLVTSMIIDDDIMDNSILRYNKPTWLNLSDIGINNAICDASFVETSAFYLLTNHFSCHPQYVNIQREMLRNYSTSMVSICMDNRQYKVHEFEKYQNYVKGYPCTVPPVLTAMYLANIDDQRLHTCARELLMDIGIYLKIEDDYEGVYGINTQKDCTDVAEGRATWLAVEAYKRGNTAQKKIIEQNYGRDNIESIMSIYKIYDELNLKEKFEYYKEDFYNDIFKRIQELPKELPQQLFVDVLDFAAMGKFRS
uniref:Terpene synthase n=1 Tax=Psylliodes chrysocephalus TaxID=3402493 RepID=A0A140AZ68_9CUCU|nr:terpene synthase [Psylliodes chrysocephala]